MKIVFLMLLSTCLFASETYLVNKEHSKIGFAVKYLGINDVEGRFNDFEIYYEVDSNKITKLEGKIAAASIDTADKKRDSHLRRSDFFDIGKYPTLSLKLVTPFLLKLNEKQEIEVALTILETTKNVKLNVVYLGPKTDPWTKVEGLYFKLDGELNRDDFGLTWNKVLDDNSGFLIAKTVKLNISIESYRSNEKPAFSRFYKEKQRGKTVSASKSELEDLEAIAEVVPANPKKVPVVVTPAPKKESQYSSFANVALTLITGFIVFLALIVFGIFSQRKISTYMEEKGYSETITYIVASGFVMIVLIIVSFFTAPLMGWGENPFLKYFN
ncbi:YceI family protein [Bacteriovorax sp. Seq25_V]|uniref:YceI family protein n=1 Tax=Bacteriovorax sp. Seq25_V TaxID=1201288 RepID=UPI00038A261F|nr:YceI family protein [Bacteriovorax sp. Seq25_V]EQC43863.1 YceI-like domain protein [Bacteriovorax sp. Seq25_V]